MEAQGALELMWRLQTALGEISGLPHVSLQPSAGSHGELAGLLLTRAYHEHRGESRRHKVLTPDTAHGTNPATVTMAGVNHNCWSFEHTYDGQDLLPLLDAAWEARRDDPTMDLLERRMLHLAVTMRSVPADYFQYYYFREETLREAQGARRTRAEVIMDALPGYWEHYREQAEADVPTLDPARSRGGIHELELALDVMSAYYNDSGARLPVNLPNAGGALPGFDEDVVVEMWCTVDAAGVHPEPQRALPHAVRGLTQALAEYQYVAAEAAWRGTRADAVRALTAHPLVPTLAVAEELYDEMAAAHAAYLPERLLR